MKNKLKIKQIILLISLFGYSFSMNIDINNFNTLTKENQFELFKNNENNDLDKYGLQIGTSIKIVICNINDINIENLNKALAEE